MTTTPTACARLRRRGFPLAALVTAGALLLAACGGGSGGSAAGIPPGAANASAASTAYAGSTTDPSAAASAGPSVPGDESSPSGTVSGSTTSSDDQAAPEEVFSVQSPWNARVTDDAIADDSALQLARADLSRSVDSQGRVVTRPSRAGVYINTRDWTDAVVAGGVPTTLVCRQVQCGEGSHPITVDVPTDVSPDPLYDGWYTVFDPAHDIAYDLWRARREADGTISFDYLREWQIDGPGFLRPYEVGARGSGLPLFGGLIRTGELEQGQIDHSLAISLPGPAASFFLQPASSTDGNGVPGAVPEGARLRLRSTFRLTPPRDPVTGKLLPFDATQRRYALTIIKALQTYGAVVVDRAAVPTLYFERTSDDDDGGDTGAGGSTLGTTPIDGTGTSVQPDLSTLQGYILQSMSLSDFEVIDYSTQTRYPYPRTSTSVDADGLPGVGTVSGTGTDSTEAGQ